MIVLDPVAYGAVAPLLDQRETHSHMSFAWAVLEGRMPGYVLVDRPEAPTAALVCNLSGFYLAFGDATGPALAAFMPTLQARYLPDEQTALFATSGAWEERLDQWLPSKSYRLGFEFRPQPGAPPLDWRARVPAGFDVRPITPAIAARFGPDGVDPWVVRIWGGADAFARTVPGFAVMRGERLASFCALCALGGGEAEIEIGTAPAYEGRGLATVVGAALIEAVRARGWTPAWTTAAANTPSIAVARKLGFVQTETIAGYALERPA